MMDIAGEKGPGVYTGTDFLSRVNSSKRVEIGRKVVVVGGGDTAVDAARVSLRLGSEAVSMSGRHGMEVTIVYRRTKEEMPAIVQEVGEALEEGVKIEYLAAPTEVVRNDSGKIIKLAVQRMKLGEPMLQVDGGRYRLKVPLMR
jgi:NADPH-dependent glutamate synthase beta subunit-like oxidoreductase